MATSVHHVEQLRSGGPLLPDAEGLEAVCDACRVEADAIARESAARPWRTG
jgi:hypothetical protein